MLQSGSLRIQSEVGDVFELVDDESVVALAEYSLPYGSVFNALPGGLRAVLAEDGRELIVAVDLVVARADTCEKRPARGIGLSACFRRLPNSRQPTDIHRTALPTEKKSSLQPTSFSDWSTSPSAALGLMRGGRASMSPTTSSATELGVLPARSSAAIVGSGHSSACQSLKSRSATGCDSPAGTMKPLMPSRT